LTSTFLANVLWLRPFSSTLLAEEDLISEELEVDFFLGLISFGFMPVKARIC
jgi:hypothetical protein